jgi:bifunctional non-homologous end joining protein LigD
LVWLGGVDLRPLPLSERRAALRELLAKASPVLSETVSIEGSGCRLYQLMCAHDLEGIVAKRLAEPYAPRTRWLKIKNPA